MKGTDVVVLVKSTNELTHTLKCIEGDKVIYYKTPDYEDYYTESEVKELKIKSSLYPEVKSELESLGFTELLNTFEQLHTDNWTLFIKGDTNDYKLVMLLFNTSHRLIRSFTANELKLHFHNI